MTKRLLFAATALVAGVSTHASSATGELFVGAAVAPCCVITTSPVAFGAYSGGSSGATGAVNIQCNLNLPHNIALDAGQNYGEAWRRVSNGAGAFIKYGLYKPTGGEWGDSDFTDTYPYGSSFSVAASGIVQSHAVHAIIFGGNAFLPAGTYSDVVNVSVYY